MYDCGPSTRGCARRRWPPPALSRSIARPRFQTLLLGLFGALALLIGAVGIYGVLSHATVLRRRELGVRLALGATPLAVVRLALGSGLRLAAIGIALGLAAALGVSRVGESLLFEISATDVATYVAVSAFLLVVSLAACALPAWRAGRIDPLQVLRS